MGIRLLGPVWVDGDDTLRPRDRRVLAALGARLGAVLTASQIADAVWGEAPPPSWGKQVQICVARLRKALGSSAIETVGGGYRLVVEGVSVDIVEFERLVARGRRLMQVGEPDRAAATFDRALATWRGTPFDDLDGWPPAQAERTRLEELRRLLDEDLLEAHLMSGDHRTVAARAEALVAEDPLRERRWAILARAQYRCGRQADALRSLQSARHRLVEQLGIDPSPDLVDLEAAILRQDAALRAIPEQRTISDECPYKGLASYDLGDRLYGRDAEIEACVDRLRARHFVVLAGPSGCGKSSLLRAGVVPALQRLGRSVAIIVPGPDGQLAVPAGLGSRAPQDQDAPVLVVDQLEELFAVGHPAETIRGACGQLVSYARDIGPVVAAVRADHLVSLGTDGSLGRLVEQGLHLVSPLAGDALRQAIERPAEQAGLRVEEGLVDLLVRDTEGEPGAMPLLSHALAETWMRRDGTVLTVEGYRASGGIRGAVARSADRLYDSLSPEQRPVVRSLLLRLVAPSVDGDPIRCRVRAGRLRGDPDRERVLALLIRSRLVTAEDEVVEISHEALARAWPRLQSWLDDDSAGQRILRHLTAAAEGWDFLGRPDSEVYRGARLATAVEYQQSAHPDLTAVEGAFLDASLRHAESERLALRARARHDARRTRRLRGLLAAALALLLVAVATGGVAARNARDARQQRDVARNAVGEARLEALVNSSLVLRSTDRDVAALLAVEAARRWPNDARSLSALLGTFTGSRGFLGYQYVEDARSLTGALIPGSSTAVVAVDQGRVELRDLETGRAVTELETSSAGSTFGRRVVVSADGGSAAVLRGVDTPECFDLDRLGATNGKGCATVSVYDLASTTRVLGPLTPPVGPGDVALSDDGSLLAVAGGYDGALAVYRMADGRLLSVVDGLPRPADADQRLDSAGVAFGPDGRVYLGSLAGPVRVIDPANGTVLRALAAPPYSSNQHVAAGPDHLVVTGGEQWLFAGNTRTQRSIWRQDIRGRHPDPCPWFAVSQAAQTVYCGNHFGQIEQRDRRSGLRTGTVLDPQLGDVGELGLTDDGDQLVAFGAQVPAISRWRLDGAGPVTRLVARGHATADGFDFADGSTLLVARRDRTAVSSGDFDDFALWDVAADRERDPLDLGWEGVGWMGRGTLIGLDPTTARFGWYDVERRAPTAGVAITTDCDHLWASAGGRYGYCGFLDGRVWTIDARTRQRVRPVIRVSGMPSSVSATRDGATVVVTARDPTARDPGVNITAVYDGRTGARRAGPFRGPDITSVSLDGVLVGARAGTVTRYDLMSGRELAELPGARGDVNTLQFSDDGRLLLATSNDQTSSLYDVASGTRLGDPLPSDAPFSYPAYLRQDGGAVAVTSARGVDLWDLNRRHLRDAACRLAGRNLNRTEWTTHLADLGRYRPTCPEYDEAT